MFRIIPEARGFSEYVLLRDGESLLLRTATAADVPAVEALTRGVSRESLQMRFMGAVSYVAPSFLTFLCTGEPDDRLCLLAVAGQGDEARVVGFGNYVSTGAHGKAEVAFLVLDAYQGRGVSTLLLERLAGIAAGQGFTGFEAEVLADNQPMINVFRDSGFEVHQAFEGGGSLHVELPVGGPASLRERVELRDRIAAASSLVPLLAPKTVAVVGASRDARAVGSMIFRAILRGGFTGTVTPVNHQATSVLGVRAAPSLKALPEPADLVVIAVPAPHVLDVAREALAAGARGLLVVASGFAEAGPEGAARQRELVELVRSHGARLVGPNCLGLQNTHPDVRLNASLAPAMARRGRIGFYSHSAALGLVILKYAEERGLGFSSFVSAGNRADVSGNDLLQFWEEDTATDIAVLYLETFGNPRRFARIARRLAHKKPILCVKSARSRAGRDAARAHIGAVAQSDTNVDILFRQAGVVRADTLEEMFDLAALLASQPLPRGDRVAIVSNSGGVLTIAADACDAQGLHVASERAVDLGPFAAAAEYEEAVERAAGDAEVDALLVLYACVGDCDPAAVAQGIRRGVVRSEERLGLAKPVLLCLMGEAGTVGLDEKDPGGGRRVFPSYRFPESAARALAQAVQHAEFRRRPAGRPLWYEDVDSAAARQEVTALLAAGGEAVLEGEPALALLARFGIRTSPAAPDARALPLEVRSDPSFGPLLRIGSAVRITPLTDVDVREMVEASVVPTGAEELLGRLSQLIEELPWVTALSGEVRETAEGAAIGGDVRVTLAAPTAAGSPRPSSS